MTREEFIDGIKAIENTNSSTKIAEHLVHSGNYIKSLEQQNTALQQERANMQTTHRNTIAKLEARIEELEECTDRMISKEKSLIAYYLNKKCGLCIHHGECDGEWGICSNIESWLYLEETPIHATCNKHQLKRKQC